MMALKVYNELRPNTVEDPVVHKELFTYIIFLDQWLTDSALAKYGTEKNHIIVWNIPLVSG